MLGKLLDRLAVALASRLVTHHAITVVTPPPVFYIVVDGEMPSYQYPRDVRDYLEKTIRDNSAPLLSVAGDSITSGAEAKPAADYEDLELDDLDWMEPSDEDLDEIEDEIEDEDTVDYPAEPEPPAKIPLLPHLDAPGGPDWQPTRIDTVSRQVDTNNLPVSPFV